MAAVVPMVVGFFWYKEDQYDRFKALCADGAKLPDTYADFRQKAEMGMQVLQRKGRKPVKVEADIEVFLAWCRANGHKVDAAGRMAFTNAMLIERVKAGQVG